MCRHIKGRVTAVLGLTLCAFAQGQTIADYSRAQRALLESTIARQGAQPAAPAAASVGLPTLSSGSTPASSPVVRPLTPSTTIQPETAALPQLDVSGVVVLPDRSLAEVQVNGVSYWLTVGQVVPGTPWSLSRIASDRVVLVKGPGAGRSRTFHLVAGH